MSDKQQHTPGPWQANVGSTGASIKGPSGESIAWCGYSWQAGKGEVPFQANAKLIEKAPELLASLTELYDYAATSTDPRFSVRSNIAHETAWKLLRELEGK